MYPIRIARLGFFNGFFNESGFFGGYMGGGCVFDGVLGVSFDN